MGKIIRSGGNCVCPPPDEYGAQPIRSELVAECKKNGFPTTSLKAMGYSEDETEYADLNVGEVSKLCNEGKLMVERYVDCYHVDEQIGLNELASVLKNLSK